MKIIRIYIAVVTLFFGGASHAGPIPINGPWQEFLWVNLGDVGLFGGCEPGAIFDGSCSGPPADTEFTSDPLWSFTAPSLIKLTVVAAGLSGTAVRVFEGDPATLLPVSLIGVTAAPGAPDFTSICDDPAVCIADPTQWSVGEFILAAGEHFVGLELEATASAGDIGFLRVQSVRVAAVPEPSGLLLLAAGAFALGAVRRRH